MVQKIPNEPFKNIALSCSGGGYRAASFHLGAMSYLNNLELNGKPLLENVKMLSTVSGGTITGAVYALKKQQGESFKQIYDFLMGQLHALDLVKLSIEKLKPTKGLLNETKRKNLINAFAELYDEHFTLGKTFADFNTMTSHLEAVVFNSTEFNNGINFRFRNTGTGYFGNNMMRVEPVAAEEVKVSDAIAASSCFPGGFEPMIWPHDFVHDNSDNLRKLREETDGTGIMDGGIYDNQGVQSLLLYKQSAGTPYFDLIIISDVASPYMEPFQPFREKPKKGFRALSIDSIKDKVKNTNRSLNTIFFGAIGVLLLLPFIWHYSYSFATGVMVGLTFATIGVLVLKQIVLSRLREAVNYLRDALFELVPPFFQSKIAGLNIERLSVHRAEPLIFDRLNSLITLLMDVFLKVVRRLNYADLYNDETFAYRRMSVLVKELTETDFTNKNREAKAETGDGSSFIPSPTLKGDYQTVVGPKIKSVVEEASSFGTTLWFTEDNQLHNMLDKLVATGQVTMCYNLVRYLEQMIFQPDNGFNELDLAMQTQIKSLYSTCLDDWAQFKNDPMFLVEAMRT